MEIQKRTILSGFILLIISSSLFFFLTIPVWAGGSKDKGNGKIALIRKAGKIVVGTSADYPPYEFHTLRNGKDELVGLDMAIGKEIAKELGVKIDFKDMRFENLLPSLQKGTIDLIIAGMIPTAERRQLADFSSIYYHTVQGILIRAADKDKYRTVDSLKTARISAQRGTIQVDIAKTYILAVPEGQPPEAPPPVFSEAGTIRSLIQDLNNGKTDAVVVEQPVARFFIAKNPDLFLSTVSFKDEEGGTAIAIKKGNSDLLQAVEKTITRLIAAKKIDQFVVEANELVEN